jgi:hypothetical protein
MRRPFDLNSADDRLGESKRGDAASGLFSSEIGGAGGVLSPEVVLTGGLRGGAGSCGGDDSASFTPPPAPLSVGSGRAIAGRRPGKSSGGPYLAVVAALQLRVPSSTETEKSGW